MPENLFEKEYYALLDLVTEFDKRLLTVKGWGVTLSLAALAAGFQYQRVGFFLVAALSGAGFWVIEGVMKRHQIRFYLRMREIEVAQYRRAEAEGTPDLSTPKIDWSWTTARRVFAGEPVDPRPQLGSRFSYRWVWFFPHVFLPHALSVIAGVGLIVLGRCGRLDGAMKW